MLLCPECESPREEILSSPCPKCGAIHEDLDGVSVLLSSKDKKNAFSKNYMELYEQIAVEDLQQSFQHLEYLHIQTDKLYSYLPKKPGMSICEIGVGQGWLLKRLPALKPSKLYGVDIAPAYFKKLLLEKLPFRAFLMNAENFCFQEEFDLVVSCDVIEHVGSIGNYLHGINRSLKKGGIFVVRTPYLEDYTCYSRFKGYKYDTMHFRNFSKETLKIVLKGAGFRVVNIHYDGFQDQLFRPFVPERVKEWIRLKYGSYIKLAAIPNAMGRLLMKPCAIAAVCEKI